MLPDVSCIAEMNPPAGTSPDPGERKKAVPETPAVSKLRVREPVILVPKTAASAAAFGLDYRGRAPRFGTSCPSKWYKDRQYSNILYFRWLAVCREVLRRQKWLTLWHMPLLSSVAPSFS